MAIEQTITITADLITGQKANLRPGPGLGSGFIETLTGPLHVEAIGDKVLMDGYYWSQIVYPKPGWIAWTTSFANIQQWGGSGTATKKVIGVRAINPSSTILVHEDGSETPLP